MKYLVTYELVPTELHEAHGQMIPSPGCRYTQIVEVHNDRGGLETWFAQKSYDESRARFGKDLVVLMVHQL